jgi:hypothetical protein
VGPCNPKDRTRGFWQVAGPGSWRETVLRGGHAQFCNISNWLVEHALDALCGRGNDTHQAGAALTVAGHITCALAVDRPLGCPLQWLSEYFLTNFTFSSSTLYLRCVIQVEGRSTGLWVGALGLPAVSCLRGCHANAALTLSSCNPTLGPARQAVVQLTLPPMTAWLHQALGARGEPQRQPLPLQEPPYWGARQLWRLLRTRLSPPDAAPRPLLREGGAVVRRTLSSAGSLDGPFWDWVQTEEQLGEITFDVKE